MNYTKPEVVVLGHAAQVIEGSLIKLGSFADSQSAHLAIVPAYDLDE
jgi:hypothetical protein